MIVRLKYFLVLSFILVLLTGCTSVGKIRERQPIFDGQSSKNPDVLAGCIADKLEAIKMPNIQVRPKTNGFIVSRIDQTIYGPDYAFVIEIEKLSSIRIVAFSALPFDAGNKMIVDSINSCIR